MQNEAFGLGRGGIAKALSLVLLFQDPLFDSGSMCFICADESQSDAPVSISPDNLSSCRDWINVTRECKADLQTSTELEGILDSID